ncbi:MAG: 1-deoxy-D-xylulose-5-phosphate synthase [Candidatus Omnitrophica bacterium]|nr:1-deoxy-D-xylulose-5-phosphate synthase [Candidatus Omnitrophota bacterium]
MSGCNYSLLDKIKSITDLKAMEKTGLPALSEEIRQFIIENVSKSGGHLGASLGAVEFTVALHYLFESPKDKIIWDVGHQSYAHKILTGRKDRFHTLRQYQGISGFPKITESEHDVYGTGHSSTSISAALGFAKARDLKKENYDVIAVIGDGAMTGGNALEAINQAGYLNTRIIVVLNDNRMSISENVGALSLYTHRIQHTDVYHNIKETLQELIEKGDELKEKLIELKRYLKEVGSPGLLFEKLGFNYMGPVDGHKIEDILDIFEQAKQINGPVLVHLLTTKGKGYSFAEDNKAKYHGVNPFNIEDGSDIACDGALSYTEVFADALVELAQKDASIVSVTAAMPDGTGLYKFQKRFPERFFDVGIAEQHAVVFAAGLACKGMKPVCAIYSSFLQRAYDAIVHDVCLQELPVVFAIDRAGIVGADGPTHHGCFDISFLRHIPNLTIMAPKDADELRKMLFTAIGLNKPVAIRYPRGCCFLNHEKELAVLEIGKCEIVNEGNDLTIVSIGTIFEEACKAYKILSKKGISATLINARFAKPIDAKIIEHIGKTGKAVLIEENALKGGFGSAVLEKCQENKVNAKVRLIGIPDNFIEQGHQQLLRKKYGLSFENIVNIGEDLHAGR